MLVNGAFAPAPLGTFVCIFSTFCVSSALFEYQCSNFSKVLESECVGAGTAFNDP